MTIDLERLRSEWMLDPEVVFLKHGSFGATRRVVLEVQQEIRNRLESEPVRFMMRDLRRRHRGLAR